MSSSIVRVLSTAAAAGVLFTATALAGDGVVALQTADPSCPDDSGDRYVDCGNGTVTDNDSGLVWLKNTNCLLTPAPEGGRTDWSTAMEFLSGLKDISADSPRAGHDCGLSDGSSAGEWRLPSIDEWEAMIADAVDLGCGGEMGPAITNDLGTECWQEGPGNSFSGVVAGAYWSSSHNVEQPTHVFVVNMFGGGDLIFIKTFIGFVWPVRGGQ